MRTKLVGAVAAAAIVAVGVTGVAGMAGASSGGSQSRLDDGAQLLSEAKISEQQAIHAAQSAASGNLDEIDLEQYQGKLVFNVDVGSKDVKVDANTGDVLAATSDD
jgi:uncharacterized membrane protein YkoI